MSDQLMVVKVFDQLAARINRWAKAKGFWDIPEAIRTAAVSSPEAGRYLDNLIKSQKQMLVVTEGAELIEGLRKTAEANDHDPEAFTNEEVEVADQIIRLLDFAGQYDLRIGACILAKMEKNEARPHRHGKAF